MAISKHVALHIADSVLATSPLTKVRETAKESFHKAFIDMMNADLQVPVGLAATVDKAKEDILALDPNSKFAVTPRMCGTTNFSLYDGGSYLTSVRLTDVLPTNRGTVQLDVKKAHHKQVFVMYTAFSAASDAAANAHSSLIDYIRGCKSVKALVAEMPELKAHLPQTEVVQLPALMDADLKKKLGLTA